jgi:glyoxylase-like metal-dependent hydrolase (beta-lactamase superfamily II)
MRSRDGAGLPAARYGRIVDLVDVASGITLLPLGVSNAYVVRDGDGCALVDTGPAGSGPAIRAALETLGIAREELRRIVLTHCHDDHAGSAADLAAWAGVPVIVGRGDAAYVRGDVPQPEPNVTPAERKLHAQVTAGLPAAPACPVAEEVDDGDMLDVAGAATVLTVPGHTPGSIALLLPNTGVLLTGDTVAESGGGVLLGPFNVDREEAWRSLRRLASLDVDVACFGHGQPVVGSAARALRAATDPFG